MKRSIVLCRTSEKPADDLRNFVAIDQRFAEDGDDTSRVLMRASDVLKELNVLLEDYSPMWFTHEQHERTEEVLCELNRLIPSCPSLSLERSL